MKKTIVLVSKCNDYLDSIKYSFKNVIELDGTSTIDERENLVKEINKYDCVILVDYLFVYRYLLQNVDKEYKWLLTYDISSLSTINNKLAYKALKEYCDRRLVSNIFCLDNNLYDLLKKAKFKVFKTCLDIHVKFKKTKNKAIGVVGVDYEPLDNYYNALTAIKLLDYKVNLCGKTNATKEFVEFFKMKHEFKENTFEVIKSSSLILECFFANLDIEKILIAMDNGVLAIVGNTDIFDRYKTLKKYLVLNSDDDVNEIAHRINEAMENSEEIFEEYKKFRNDYRKDYNKSIEQILK